MHLDSMLPQWDIPRSGLEALYKSMKPGGMSQGQGPYLSNSNKYLIFRTLSTSTRVFLASSSACCSSNPLILVPIVFEYTSSPSHVDCSLTELTSRFHGFEHTTAPLSSHFSPSSPRYYKETVIRRTPHNVYLITVRTLTRIIREFLPQPLHHLSDVPCRPRIIQDPGSNLTPRTATTIHHASFPFP